LSPTLPALLLLGASAAALAGLSLAPRPGQPVLAVFPPWTSNAAAFEDIVTTGWIPIASPRAFAIVALPAPGATPPGAFLVLDARGARGCSPRKT
jgi:hypothetical protein